MVILLGLAVLAGLICIWLTGNQFGRILAFLLLACVGGLVGLLLVGSASDFKDTPPLAALFVGGLGVALAWPIASIPVYRQRARKRQAQRAPQVVYPLHWTLAEMEAYERAPTVAAEYLPAKRFPALPSP